MTLIRNGRASKDDKSRPRGRPVVTWNSNDEADDDGTAFDGPVKCTYDRPLAILCTPLSGGEPFWVPKSVLHDNSEVYAVGHSGSLVVKTWWAEKEGW